MGGGAIYSTSGLIVSNNTFTNNSATNDGGAIYNFVPGTLIVDNNTFINNTANQGGAIYTNNPYITTDVNFNRFIKNTASSGNAIYDSVGTVNATDACGKFDSTKKYTFIDNPLLIIGYEICYFYNYFRF